jgi:uncharacterized protein (DUF1330 family)
MKKLIMTLIAAGVFALGAGTLLGQAEKKKKGKKAAPMEESSAKAPKSVIHVVTVAWKPEAKPADIKAALDGVKKLADTYPGITRVWTRSIKVQNPKGTETKRTHVFVMEFASEQALKDYTDSDAQKEWYKVYTPIRLESTTHDITN